MLAQLIIMLRGTDKKAMPTFSLQLLLEEMEQATQRYALPEKLCTRLFLAYRSGNANAGQETDSPRLTPTHLSDATATLLFAMRSLDLLLQPSVLPRLDSRALSASFCEVASLTLIEYREHNDECLR